MGKTGVARLERYVGIYMCKYDSVSLSCPCAYPSLSFLIFPYPTLRDLVVSKMETTAIFYLDIDSKTSICITC